MRNVILPLNKQNKQFLDTTEISYTKAVHHFHLPSPTPCASFACMNIFFIQFSFNLDFIESLRFLHNQETCQHICIC